MLRRESGGDLRPGARLGRGGQGEVFEVVGRPELVFKRIHDTALSQEPTLEARLRAMVGAPPPTARESGSGHVLLAWPSDLVREGGSFVGYVMPRIDLAKTAELHAVTNSSDRANPSRRTPGWVRGFTWRYLLQSASNLAVATQAVHDGGYVIGDFNERNVLVWPEARVTLIDCDSMQVRHGSTDFLCRVGRPEFTAPELLGEDLSRTVRRPSSDLFALAVHVYQLLMDGAHPFDGRWSGPGDKPKRQMLAQRGIFANAAHTHLAPQPSAISFQTLPKELQALFRRAFIDGASDPERRPAGTEWTKALERTSASLAICPRDSSHLYPAHNSSCPWCVLAGPAPVQRPLPAASGGQSARAARPHNVQLAPAHQGAPAQVGGNPTIALPGRQPPRASPSRGARGSHPATPYLSKLTWRGWLTASLGILLMYPLWVGVGVGIQELLFTNGNDGDAYRSGLVAVPLMGLGVEAIRAAWR